MIILRMIEIVVAVDRSFSDAFVQIQLHLCFACVCYQYCYREQNNTGSVDMVISVVVVVFDI